jgi:hypothetical protein
VAAPGSPASVQAAFLAAVKPATTLSTTTLPSQVVEWIAESADAPALAEHHERADIVIAFGAAALRRASCSEWAINRNVENLHRDHARTGHVRLLERGVSARAVRGLGTRRLGCSRPGRRVARRASTRAGPGDDPDEHDGPGDQQQLSGAEPPAAKEGG